MRLIGREEESVTNDDRIRMLKQRVDELNKENYRLRADNATLRGKLIGSKFHIEGVMRYLKDAVQI